MPLAYRAGDDRRFIRDVIPLFQRSRATSASGTGRCSSSRARRTFRGSRRGWRPGRASAPPRGLAPPYLCLVQDAEGADPRAYGFDAAIEFPPHGLVVSDVTSDVADLEPSFAGRVWDYVSGAKWAIARPLPEYPFFRGVMTGWDNTPRLPRNGNIFVNAHPANYQRWLASVVAQARAKPVPEERFVFINAWNEWAEGAYLEPDEHYGRQFLEATRRALDGK